MTDQKTQKPEWVPENAGGEFACRVMPAADYTTAEASVRAAEQKVTVKKLSAQDYADGILNGNRMLLAKAITLVESNAPKHFDLAQEIIRLILPYAGKAKRVGITGVPGAGKSTFIEAIGCYLCQQGHRVAVLAVDPSSTVSHGSILGDKTRMENLSKEENAFIRPSPSGGTLGGVTRKSRETMLLCEAAGYDTILVETVGVGQGETTVRSMVDFFLYVVLTGAGDDLQGIKKGIMELADAIMVNKADGDNKRKALVTRADYEQILHYIRPATEGWTTKAYTCSALTGEGIAEIWDVIQDFDQQMRASNQLFVRRQEQSMLWVQQMAMEHLQHRVEQNTAITACREHVQQQVLADQMTATMAAKVLIETIDQELAKGPEGSF